MSSFDTGYLEIIIGCMFSGKTSRLLEVYKKSKFCNIKVCVINHSADTRYHEVMLSTHDGTMIPCIQTGCVNELWDKSNSTDQIQLANVILINESQFFEKLYSCVNSMLDKNKHVYIAGLDGDFNRCKFGEILDLIPLADKVIKLNALCGKCKNGTEAIFSLRITNEKEQFIIGSDNYIPVCRKCYKLHFTHF